MTSSEESPFALFKSKKILRSASSSSSSKLSTAADGEPTSVVLNRNPWSSKTPEKPVNRTPRRTSNRLTAFSVKNVREAAEKLRKSRPKPCIEPDPNISDGLETARSSGAATSIVREKKADDLSHLPERYQMLVKFFDSLDNSIRLLCLKGSITTFSNISPKIEAFTNRRFTYSHLAQIKYILPEAIEIKKILTRDQLTFCMKPNLHITLNIDAITERKKQPSSQSGHLYMRKIFRNRLLDYFKSHSEGDIPEETLPEPFNKSKQDVLIKDVLIRETVNSSLNGERSTYLPASHLSNSFRRGFSKKASQTELSTNPVESIPVSKNLSDVKFTSSTMDDESKTTDDPSSNLPVTPLKVTVESIPVSNLSDVKFTSSTMDDESKTTDDPSSNLPVTPLKVTVESIPISNLSDAKFDHESQTTDHPSSNLLVTPLKETVVSKNDESFGGMTPLKLMSATPTMKTPKRCFMTPNNNDDTSSPGKLLKRPPRSRTLKFDSPVKCKKKNVDDDILDILPEHLLQSIREKEMKAIEERDPAISQAKWRRQMISSLPKLFDAIVFLYQSIKRSVLTKNDLIQKIISSHLDVVDRREIEEQIRLLQEMAPEWIYEKLASSGDLLVCVNKISNPESIRARMAEAK